MAAPLLGCGIGRSSALDGLGASVTSAVDGGSIDDAPPEDEWDATDPRSPRGTDEAGDEHDNPSSNAVDAAGVPAVAECLQAPNAIYVVVTGGYAGLNDGASEITGDAGTWIVPAAGPGRVQIDSPGGAWGFAATAAVIGASYELAPGATFNSGLGAGSASAQVLANGAGCDRIPTGTFTVVDVALNGDQLVRFLASFALVCGDAGSVVGCARYTQ